MLQLNPCYHYNKITWHALNFNNSGLKGADVINKSLCVTYVIQL